MNISARLVVLSLLCLNPGCAADTPEAVEKELRSAEMVRIGYTVDRQTKYVTVDDAATLQPLLAALDVADVERGMQAGMEALGTVEFTLPGGQRVETTFLEPDQLDRSFWGQLYLADTKFYQHVCKIASEAEGRPIDVLKNNDDNGP